MRAGHLIVAVLLFALQTSRAQTDSTLSDTTLTDDGVTVVGDSLTAAAADTLTAPAPAPAKHQRQERDRSTWRPSAKKAMWLAIVLPGAGQIYNRKYWKLPIVYGGFVGCIYAYRWNNQMYHDYSQAYMDIMDDNPDTESYNSFLHLGTTITEDNKSTYQNKFKKRKDLYRKWRDLSVFALIGVYALSIIDAYVDASLSEFDITEDLSLNVGPAVINTKASGNALKSSALGLQCALNF